MAIPRWYASGPGDAAGSQVLVFGVSTFQEVGGVFFSGLFLNRREYPVPAQSCLCCYPIEQQKADVQSSVDLVT